MALFQRIQIHYLWAKISEICLVALDMCDFQNISQIFYILLSLGIHRGNVNLGPRIGNFEVQMDVPFE